MPEIVQPYFIWRDEVDSKGMMRRFASPPAAVATFPEVQVQTGVAAPLVRLIAHTALDRVSVWLPRARAEGGATTLTLELRGSIVEGYTASTFFGPLAKGLGTFFANPLFAPPVRGVNCLVWTVWGFVDAGTASVNFNVIADRSSCCESEP